MFSNGVIWSQTRCRICHSCEMQKLLDLFRKMWLEREFLRRNQLNVIQKKNARCGINDEMRLQNVQLSLLDVFFLVGTSPQPWTYHEQPWLIFLKCRKVFSGFGCGKIPTKRTTSRCSNQTYETLIFKVPRVKNKCIQSP